MTSFQPAHNLPVLPLRDIVVFPHMIVPLFVGRERSVRALEEVMADNKQILLLTQVDAATEDPESNVWRLCLPSPRSPALGLTISVGPVYGFFCGSIGLLSSPTLFFQD